MTPDDRTILFVLGGARSGTTYVNRIVNNWFDYGMGPEGAFVADFYARRERYGDLRDDAALDRLVDDISRCRMLEIMRSKWPEEGRIDITPAMIRGAVTERSLAGVIYAVFRCVCVTQRKSRVGNKWPDYWRHLTTLDRLFGDRARYLFVLRDGRDVALSTMKMRWGEKTSYACAKSWAACVQAVERFAQGNPEVRLKTIRYEDLLSDPGTAWLELEQFFDCPPDEARRTAFVESVAANPKRNNSSKWRTQMSRRDQHVYEAVAGPWLARYGYDLAHESPRISRLEKVFFSLAEIARKIHWTARFKLQGADSLRDRGSG